ncbi:uncharacterized protein LOC129921120 [Episyrphus balteatus]|uniref:uncharacterized protein LOC129921120 n=1 Tax=Episyrphus balteatus TaxID=286459 RepID=UPI0024855EB9|nr:uncharacterized protein LOC129921120 [Episyrphus balteatus]
MGLRLNGCYCVSIRTAGLVQGWLSILFTIVIIGFTLIRIIFYDDDGESILSPSSSFDIFVWFGHPTTLNFEIICLMLFICDGFFTGMLLSGILCKKPNRLLPSLIFRGIALLILIQYAFKALHFAAYSIGGEIVLKALLLAFFTGFCIWVWIALYSLYKDIRRKVDAKLLKKMQLPRQMPVQYIESREPTPSYSSPSYRVYDY